MYWEDSRMYFRTWNRVTLISAYPKDPSPKAPVKITVTENGLRAQSCETCPEEAHPGAQHLIYERDLVEAVHETEIWQLLESKRCTGDWKILLAFGDQRWNSMIKDLVVWPAQHEFFVFPEDQVRCGETESGDTSLRKSIQAFSKTYRFKHLDAPGSQWLVTTFNEDIFNLFDLNEPLPGNADDRYAQRHIFNSEYASGLKDESATPIGMEYSISGSGDKRIDVTVPYVPYEHFQSSRAYDQGFTYMDYLRLLLTVTTKRGPYPYDFRQRWCTTHPTSKKELPLWKLSFPSTAKQESSRRRGFLNNIPTGLALLDSGAYGNGFSLLSSNWPDWTTFTLHQPGFDRMPVLKLHSGEQVKCHGYVTGTWTEGDTLSKQWTGLTLYVVDCEFGTDGAGEQCHILLNPEVLGARNLHLSKGSALILYARSLNYYSDWSRKEFFCGALNMCFFRYVRSSEETLGSRWKGKRKPQKKKEDVNTEDLFWDEMNRREKWDRDFEKRTLFLSTRSHLYDGDEYETAALEEKRQEDAARVEWDTRNTASL